MSNSITATEFNFPGQKAVYHGKVRDVYTLENDLVVMVASDRISAFDHILPKGIPHKGQVLNQIATIFLDIENEIIALEQSLSKYQILKQGMMQELLTGKTRLV